MKALKAAVAAGADAVYLAGEKFGARHYADNFSLPELEKALNYAHLRGLKLYVTVNTLQKDEELPAVADYLYWLYEKGADGVIVQDLGVAGLARDLVPKLPLHASTQMTIHNQEGVKWAAGFGFKRVILAREMKLAEIKRIPGEVQGPVELEVFVHGALCYSYSGQCLFSSLIGGRSGNRGMCAQPCRKTYQLFRGGRDQYGKPLDLTEVPWKEDYLLSTRDLSVYPYLEEVVNSNISSLKIEGRMRSPEYVALVVSTYRQALDSIKNRDWRPRKKDVENLKLSFNRGFTRGHILEAPPEGIMGRESPGNRGLYLGLVTHWDPVSRRATLELESSNPPQKGDGLVFTTANGKKVVGLGLENSPDIQKGKVIIKTLKKVQPGYKVFMTRKESLQRWASDLIKNPSPPTIILDLHLRWDDEFKPLINGQITTTRGEVIPITYHAKFAMDPAQKRPLSEAKIREQFQKTGGTIFTIRTIQIEYPGGLFSPLSVLNSLRRDFLEEVERMLIEHHRPDRVGLKPIQDDLKRIKSGLTSDLPAPIPRSTPDVVAWVSDLESLKKVVEGEGQRVALQASTKKYLNSKRGIRKTLKLMERAIAMVEDSETELIWKWPLITPHNILINLDLILTELADSNLSGVMVDGLGASEVVKTRPTPLKLYGSTGLNVWNHRTIQELAESFQGLNVSPELSRDDLKKLTHIKRSKKLTTELEILVQGNQEVLISEDSLVSAGVIREYDDNDFWGIKDSKGHLFPVGWDPDGRVKISNSVELCLIDHLPSLLKMGWDGLVIDARGKPAPYTGDMLGLYQEALQLSLKKPAQLAGKLKILKEEVKKRSTGGITSGNFLRGVVN